MAYPLQNWTTLKRGYRFMQPTSYSKFHLGTDYIVNTVPVIAPFDGDAVFAPFAQGGNTINLTCVVGGKKYVMRFMHLSKVLRTGPVKEGDVFAVTGNTGTQTTGPHVHIDISKDKVNVNDIKNFVDPDKFNWLGQSEELKGMYEKGVTLEMLSTVSVKDVPTDGAKQIAQLQRTNRCEVTNYTPDWRWYEINAAGTIRGWIKNEGNMKAVVRDNQETGAAKKLEQVRQIVNN